MSRRLSFALILSLISAGAWIGGDRIGAAARASRQEPPPLFASAQSQTKRTVRLEIEGQVQPALLERMFAAEDTGQRFETGDLDEYIRGIEAIAYWPGQEYGATASDIFTVSLGSHRTLRTTQAAIHLLKRSEGFVSTPYIDGEHFYIGYGHQIKPGDPLELTSLEADELLHRDLKKFEKVVRSVITRPMTDNEFSAMVTLAYNIGSGNFSRSSLVRRFNENDRQGAADAFLHWTHAHGEYKEGLARRREAERALFLSSPS